MGFLPRRILNLGKTHSNETMRLGKIIVNNVQAFCRTERLRLHVSCRNERKVGVKPQPTKNYRLLPNRKIKKQKFFVLFERFVRQYLTDWETRRGSVNALAKNLTQYPGWRGRGVFDITPLRHPRIYCPPLSPQKHPR